MFAKHSQLQVQSSVTTLSTSIDNKEDKSENESEDNDSVTGTSFMETGEEKNASTDNIDMDDEFDIKSSDNQSLKRSKVGDSI